MSTALNRAIRKRLTGEDALTGDGLECQQALEALLAADPADAGYGAVYMGNLASSPVFPCITFRPEGGIGHWASRSEELGVISQPEYTFEVWGAARNRNPDVITDILDYIEQLLDDRRSIATNLPPLTLSTGWYCVAMHTIMDPVLRYDEGQNRWFGLVRMQAITQRYKQGS